MFALSELHSTASGSSLLPERHVTGRRRAHAHRRTRTGNVRRVCADCYARDDIPCGVAGCRLCAGAGRPGLAVSSESASVEYDVPHLLLVDSATLMDRYDAMVDERCQLFTDIVIPHTVWKEVSARSVRRAKELRDTVYEDDRRRWHLFYNQYHTDTFDDSPVDFVRECRALIKCAKWYKAHCAPLGVKEVVILTDEESIASVAKRQGLYATSIKAYLGSLKTPRPDLLDKAGADEERANDKDAGLNLNAKIGSRKRGAVTFAGHLSQGEMRRGLATGRFIKGTFQVSRDNYLEAYVYPSASDTDADVATTGEQVLVQGLLNCNRAIQGDLVCMEMLPKAEWSRPARELRMRDFEESSAGAKAAKVEPGAESEPAARMEVDLGGGGGNELAEHGEEEEDDDDVLIDDEDRIGPADALRPDGGGPKAVQNDMPTAKVVGVLRRNWRPYCGILLLPPGPVHGYRHLFSPAEKRVPRVRVECRMAESLRAKRIVVSIDDWPADSRYPRGHYLRTLGDLGDRVTENEVLLLEHDVPHEKFNNDILACLPRMPWTIGDDDVKARRDLRHLDICSVDPPGCTDIDDALHCRPVTADGGGDMLEIGVHIADVSHFVRAGTPMDLEARRRGTTVYLCDRRVDMLPELLSGNLCSLRGGEERFAFSVIWHIDRHDLTVHKVDYCKSIIRSRAALTYKMAQERIDNADMHDAITLGLRRLNDVAKRLRAKRTAQGALKLASVEIRFKMDSETHDPIGVQEKEALETHSLVEEFMLLANMAVARRICDEYPDCAVLRRHPVPGEVNYKPLVAAAAARGIQLRASSGKELSDSLDSAVINDNPYFNTVLRIITTRCMTQAVYFAAGSVPPSDYVHYGLAAPIYTHFTSPIRRYADLMVHRLLAAAIGADDTFDDMLQQSHVGKVCLNLNYRHKQAQYAGRASVLLNTHMYFKERAEVLDAYVLSVRRNAIQVLIPRYGLESAVAVRSDAPFAFGESATGGAELRWSSGVIRPFDKVVVRISLDTTDVQHNRLKLELVEPSVDGFSVRPVLEFADKPVL